LTALQGIKLGPNVRAVTDLAKVVQGATVLVFVTPHQFVSGVIKQMQVCNALPKQLCPP